MIEKLKKKIVPARMPTSERDKTYLLNMIMEHSYPGEKLEMSLARLAMAAGYLGKRVLGPVEVWYTYRVIKKLSTEPYKPRSKQK